MNKWPMVKLGDVCEGVVTNIAQKDLANNEGDYPIYGASGFIKRVDFYKQEKPYIAVVKDGAGVGRVSRLPEKSSAIGTMQCVLPNDSIDTGYLYYAMSKMDLARFYSGATIPHIYFKDYKKEQIPLPPLPIQQKIATVLDKASALIEKRKEQIAKLDLLVKSQFVEMFGDPVKNPMGWEVKRLKEITSAIRSGNTPKGGEQVYVNSGIMFFRSQNVWRNKIVLDDIAYIDEKTHRSMKQTSLKNKDILITKTGRFNTENSSLGRAALFVGEDGSANINGHVYLVRLKEGNVCEFVLFILVSDEYKDYIRKVCVGGIDKRQINKEHLEEFPIILPPLSLQNEFAEFVRTIDRLKSAIQKALGKQELLYKSLMQKCFNGEMF